MQAPTFSFKVISAQAMLVPSMINRFYVPCQNQQKRRKRPQMIDPLLLLLHRHPLLHLLRVPLLPPRVHVHHHHPRVEIARLPSLERLGQNRVRPKIIREIQREVCMAIFRRSHQFSFHVNTPKLGYVVNHHQVRIKVYDAFHVFWYGIGEIYSGVIQGLVQGLPNGLGYLAADPVGVKAINFHVEVREGGSDAGEEFGSVVMGGEEVEGQVLRARGMLQNGEDRGHGAAEVVGVEGHGDVDGVGWGGAALLAVAEGGGLPEERKLRGGTADEAEANGGGGGREEEEEEEEGQEAN